jgi:hypothetical protein
MFAREHRLRLVIKGGGHSYQGTSNAPDSLLIWTRNMNRITVHEMFVCTGCEDQATATPAVTVEAGAIWGQVYDAVVSKAGQGLDQKEAEDIWRPLLDWVVASTNDLAIVNPIRILAAPARRRWDPEYLKQNILVLQDDRPGATSANVFWAGNQEEAGMVLHAYQSAWIPALLLQPDRQEALFDSLLAAAKHWDVVLHTNKGLAGGTPEAIATTKDTAMNPAVADAFALLICANAEQPAYPGVAGHEPDVVTAHEHARAVERAMKEIHNLVPIRTAKLQTLRCFSAVLICANLRNLWFLIRNLG